MTAVAEQPTAAAEDMGAAIEGFAMRLLGSAIGMMDLATIRLGKELGLYEVLASNEPQTPGELAQLTGTDERYIREWLEQQAVTGILTVDDTAAPADRRRYAMPPAHVEVLVNRSSPAYLGALGYVTDMTAVLSSLVEAFRDGRGLQWAHYGDNARKMQAELNRPGYLDRAGNPDSDERTLRP